MNKNKYKQIAYINFSDVFVLRNAAINLFALSTPNDITINGRAPALPYNINGLKKEFMATKNILKSLLFLISTAYYIKISITGSILNSEVEKNT